MPNLYFIAKKIKKGGIQMLDLEALVPTTWNNSMKKYYEDLGYKFTGRGKSFMVKIKDLYPNSSVKVSPICDYCGEMVKSPIPYANYNSQTENGTIKFACGNRQCMQQKQYDKYAPQRIQGQYQRFIDFCEKHNYIPVSQLNNIDLILKRELKIKNTA